MLKNPHILLLLLAVAAAGAAVPLSGCDTRDDTYIPGGSVPRPSGLMHGSVVIAGPRPQCVYDGDTATELMGNVILLMFNSDNPPPPSGSATSASNLLVIPAREVYELADCLPAEPTIEDQRVVITRGAGFTWPNITLPDDPDPSDDVPVTIDYQIRGFFDRDADFNPFFSVRRLATYGDIAGGAFVNTSESPPQFTRINFGSTADFPNGQVVDGVGVVLGGFVRTELPAFELGAPTHATLSENTIPPVADPAIREQMIFDQTNMELTLINPMSDSWANTLQAAGMQITPTPDRFAWFTLPVDANRDGVQDPHPILGSGGVLWEHPIVILRRARSTIELLSGIPDALVIATVRPTQTASKQTFAPTIQIGVAPIAAVNLNPADPQCNIPYIPPGNLVETLERIPVDCQELPTGNYDINVLSGHAGGRTINYRQQLLEEMPGLPDTVLNTLVSTRTDNDWVIEGSSYSSQAWSVPNELGCPDPYRPNTRDADGRPITVSQIDEDPLANCGDPAGACDASGTNMQCSQGPAGRFSIVDPNGRNAPDANDTTDGHGVATCQTSIRAATMMPDTVTYMPVPEQCCLPSIVRLCGLPLCPLRPSAVLPGAGGENMIREIVEPGVDFMVGEDGSITPLCTPFYPPVSCCR